MPLKLSDIRLPRDPVGEIDGLGELFVGRAALRLYTLLEREEHTGELSDERLVNTLIEGLVTQADDQPLTKAEIATLKPEARDRIIGAICAAHPRWFEEQPEEGGDPVPVLRDPNESDEAYLARCFRLDKKREFGRLAAAMTGLSDRMKSVLGTGLAANIAASARLGDAMKAISHPEPIRPVRDFTPIKLPPNPIHETNETLAAVAKRIEQMAELAAATAAMQKSLNDTASAAVADFSQGAEASKATAQWSLRVAWIALAISVLTGGAQWWQSSNQDRAEEERAGRLIASEEALAKALTELKNEQERSRNLPGGEVNKPVPDGQEPRPDQSTKRARHKEARASGTVAAPKESQDKNAISIIDKNEAQ